MSATPEAPDRLFIAFLEEYNLRHPDGSALDPQVQQLVGRYIRYAKTLAAEGYIQNLTRGLELAVKKSGMVNYRYVIDLVRSTPHDCVVPRLPQRKEYIITPSGEIIEEPVVESMNKKTA
jgi:hypothetical protein